MTEARQAPTGLWAVLRRLRRRKLALVGCFIVVAMVFIALAAPWIMPQDPSRTSLVARLLPPGSRHGGTLHLLGTDALGRDLLSQLLIGARISLLVGLSAVLLGGSIGIILGAGSTYLGRGFEAVTMRVADVQLSFPSFLLALALLAVFGSGLTNVILVLAISEWVQYARVARGQTLVVMEQEFFEAARALGVRRLRLLVRHVLPNIMSPLIVIGSFSVARAIIAEASLSFLGVGVSPEVPTWGGILARGRDYIRDAWWLVMLPGLAIMVTVLGINVVGDFLRDLLDPHQRLGRSSRWHREGG